MNLIVQDIAKATCDQMVEGVRGMLAIDPWDEIDVLQQEVWCGVVWKVLEEARLRGLVVPASFR
jgi:hypothetical protein